MLVTALAGMVLVRFRNETEVTFTNTWQVLLGASVAPVTDTEPSPGVAAIVAPLQVVEASGVA